MEFWEERMKTIVSIAAIILFGTPALSAPVQANFRANVPAQSQQSPGTKSAQATAQPQAPKSASPTQLDESARADVYYYFTMGHVNEQQYELTGRSEDATASIDFYKKALAIQPSSPVIMERLAEIYAKSQRIRDAVAEAQE